MAISQKARVTRNKDLVTGIGKFSISKMDQKRGLWAIKLKNGGSFPHHDSAPTPPKPSKFYPAYDVPKPLKNNRKQKPTKLRSVYGEKGCLLETAPLWFASSYRKRGQAWARPGLGQVWAGLGAPGCTWLGLGVRGWVWAWPRRGSFKVNGVPLRRVNQAYVIAASTKVDISGVGVEKFNDKYFVKETEKKKKKGEGEFFEEKEETKVLTQEKDDQKSVDGHLIKAIEAVPDLKAYLASRFSLRSGMKPHELVF